MLIHFNKNMFDAGIKSFLAKKYGVSVESISQLKYSYEEFSSGEFTSKVFNNDSGNVLVIDFVVHYKICCVETVSDPGFIYDIVRQYMLDNFQTKVDVEELLPCDSYNLPRDAETAWSEASIDAREDFERFTAVVYPESEV